MLPIYLSMLDTYEDRNKFEKIYLEYRQDMYAIAYGILKNKEDSEDAVHQAFLKIAENFSKLSVMSSENLRSYIVIICKNTATDIYRKNKRRSEHLVSINEIEISDKKFEDENFTALKAAVKMLPRDYWDVLYLHCLQDFSTGEIAKSLGLTESNVRQRICRAKKMLMKILKDGESDD